MTTPTYQNARVIAGTLRETSATALAAVAAGWSATQASRMRARLGLSESQMGFLAGPAGIFRPDVALPTGLAAADIDGGGLVATANSNSLTSTVVSNPATKAWAVAFRALIPAPSSGKVAFLGLRVGATTNSVKLGTWYAAGPTEAHTYLIALQYKASPAHQVATVTTHVPGATWHDYMLTLSGTPLRVWADDTLLASEINLVDVPTGAANIYVESTSNNVYVSRFAVGYEVP